MHSWRQFERRSDASPVLLRLCSLRAWPEAALTLWDVCLCRSTLESELWSTVFCAVPAAAPPNKLLHGLADGTFWLLRHKRVFLFTFLSPAACCPVCCCPRILPLRSCTSPASHICRRRFCSSFQSQPLVTSPSKRRHRYRPQDCPRLMAVLRRFQALPWLWRTATRHTARSPIAEALRSSPSIASLSLSVIVSHWTLRSWAVIQRLVGPRVTLPVVCGLGFSWWPILKDVTNYEVSRRSVHPTVIATIPPT